MYRTIEREEAFKVLKLTFKLSTGAVDALDRLTTYYQGHKEIYTNQADLLEILNVGSYTTVGRRMRELAYHEILHYTTDSRGTIIDLTPCHALSNAAVKVGLTLRVETKTTKGDIAKKTPSIHPETDPHTHPESNPESHPPTEPENKGTAIEGEADLEGSHNTPICPVIIPVRSTHESDILEGPEGVFSYL